MLTRLRAFAKDGSAAVAIEAIVLVPILAWCFTASFIFFDAFRTYSSSVKATYAVADVVSRQTSAIFDSDIHGLGMIFEHITRNPNGGDIRVSQIRFQGFDLNGNPVSRYFVDWSVPTGGQTRLRSSALQEVVGQLPNMVDGERLILVESFVPYRPYLNMGIADFEFENFTVIRPRFAGQVTHVDGLNPACSSCNFGDFIGNPSANTSTDVEDSAEDDEALFDMTIF